MSVLRVVKENEEAIAASAPAQESAEERLYKKLKAEFDQQLSLLRLLEISNNVTLVSKSQYEKDFYKLKIGYFTVFLSFATIACIVISGYSTIQREVILVLFALSLASFLTGIFSGRIFQTKNEFSHRQLLTRLYEIKENQKIDANMCIVIDERIAALEEILKNSKRA